MSAVLIIDGFMDLVKMHVKLETYKYIEPASGKRNFCYGRGEVGWVRCRIHGGESSDILYLYSDRTGRKIDHCFLNT